MSASRNNASFQAELIFVCCSAHFFWYYKLETVLYPLQQTIKFVK
jgi:hypothetical protein